MKTPDGRLGIIEFPDLPQNDFLDESSDDAMASFAPVRFDPTTCALTPAE